MCDTKRWLVWVLIVLLVTAAGSAADDKPKQARPGIRVEVRFSVKEFDPKNPKEGFLECVVHNGTDRPIKVPTGYSAGFDSNVVLYGRAGKKKTTSTDVHYYGWELRLVQRDKKRAVPDTSFTVVEPGKSRVVFKDGLNELLIERKRSGWDWQA